MNSLKDLTKDKLQKVAIPNNYPKALTGHFKLNILIKNNGNGGYTFKFLIDGIKTGLYSYNNKLYVLDYGKFIKSPFLEKIINFIIGNCDFIGINIYDHENYLSIINKLKSFSCIDNYLNKLLKKHNMWLVENKFLDFNEYACCMTRLKKFKDKK